MIRLAVFDLDEPWWIRVGIWRFEAGCPGRLGHKDGRAQQLLAEAVTRMSATPGSSAPLG